MQNPSEFILKRVFAHEPCPFCGDNDISLVQKYYPGAVATVTIGYSVGCQNLSCMGCHTYARIFDTEEKAIKAWNKRNGV